MKEPQLIDLPKFADKRGSLSIIQELVNIPFVIERVYWIYDVPGGEIRGSHAFKEQQELIVALSGSFDVVLHDGEKEQVFSLNRSNKGVLVPKLYWRTIRNFSSNALAFVLASTRYSETDYIRDFDEFIKLRNQHE
ncbi:MULTISPECIES: sugar 3,4-ketoisomerase [Myroides]|uniref:WxcM-like domain-containing protein n=1 Tax=Myroides albus TaxID=2562892 RepID=A0A6I3LJH3_9FLAO|nr:MULTISPECIES: FdtA/QdtA family cupin domain-containing protein [Myroides]MTG98728.1 WxcM-like domain-containing protein [Myroides albus]MVX37143.1 WxcM-like domain-containing protein [Myroides sp. LoEW2-1]UVD79073.1 FdtA/QdtA family cupin domain-containing protein [Myroides albus]